jgi:hypothetical protein
VRGTLPWQTADPVVQSETLTVAPSGTTLAVQAVHVAPAVGLLVTPTRTTTSMKSLMKSASPFRGRRNKSLPPAPSVVATTYDDACPPPGLEVFLTKTDSCSGAQVIQAVQDLNTEIIQLAAGATENVTLQGRDKTPQARMNQATKGVSSQVRRCLCQAPRVERPLGRTRPPPVWPAGMRRNLRRSSSRRFLCRATPDDERAVPPAAHSPACNW